MTFTFHSVWQLLFPRGCALLHPTSQLCNTACSSLWFSLLGGWMQGRDAENPSSVQLQRRRARADKITALFSLGAQCFREELLKVSFTREQRNLNKRAPETSAWNSNSDLLSPLLLWRQLNIFLFGFPMFTILGDKERADKFLFPPPPPMYRLWQSSWNWLSNFFRVGNTCRPVDLQWTLQTSQISPVLSRYSVALLLSNTFLSLQMIFKKSYQSWFL